MEFILLTEQEFEQFSINYENSTFLQTTNMAQYQIKNNRIVYFPAVKIENRIVCASFIFGIKTRMSIYYSCPRGFLIDYNNQELLKYYVENIKKLLKENNGYCLNIEPNILYNQRDINGLKVVNGFNNQYVIDNLLKNGFKHNKISLESDPNKQVRWTFRLTYDQKDENVVFNNFNSKTKRIIKKAIKSNLEVKEVEYKYLDKFKLIIDSTGERKSFGTRSLKYYQDMYNSFDSQKIKFLAIHLNINKYISQIKDDLTKLTSDRNKIEFNDKNKKKIIELDNQINSINKRINIMNELGNKYPNELMISVGMFLIHKNTTTYLFGGSYDDFMFLNGQYLLQWEIIKYGISNGCTNHDFYGITGDLSKENPKYGVYEFKRGFDGCVEEYIGDFDLILKPFVYKLHKLI